MALVLWAVAIAVILFLPSRAARSAHRIDHPAERFLRDRDGVEAGER